jgi:hypothetical protein
MGEGMDWCCVKQGPEKGSERAEKWAVSRRGGTRRDARSGGRGVLARLERLDGGGDGQDDR